MKIKLRLKNTLTLTIIKSFHHHKILKFATSKNNYEL